MSDKELSIKLLLDDKEALSKLSKALDQVSRDSKKTTDSMNLSWAGLASQIYIVKNALQPMISGISDAVQASIQQEDAVKRLNAALESQGTFTENLSAKYQEMADTFQTNSRFSDDAVLQVMQTLVTLGNVGPQQMEQVTQAVLDFSAATGRDLESSALIFAKAANGNTAALGKMGIVIDESVPKAERLGAAVDAVNKKMGGRAKEDIKSFGGQVKQLGNMWNELQESIGDFVTKTPEFKDAVKLLNVQLKDLKTYLSSKDAQDGFRIFLLEVAKTSTLAAASIERLSVPIEKITERWNALKSGTAQIDPFKGIVGGVDSSKSDEMMATYQALIDKAVEYDQKIQEIKNRKNEPTADSSAIDSGPDFENQKKLEQYETDRQNFISKEQEKVQGLRDMWSYWNDEKTAMAMTQMENETAFLNLAIDTQKQAHASLWTVAGKMKDTFQSGVSEMFKGMVRGTMTVGEAFEQLGLKMVDILIDYGVQMAVNNALSKVFTATETAASVASAATVAAAWAPAAANVSLATFGSNAGAAAVGMTSAHALSRSLSVIPGAQDGGDVARSGAVLVGERGPEILDLPQGARVTPLEKNGGGSVYHISIEINNPVFEPGDLSDQLVKEIGPRLSQFIDHERERL